MPEYVPIFPDLPVGAGDGSVEGLVAPSSNGLDARSPSGVMGGLNRTLISLLANYEPGPVGVCVIDDKLQLALPLPEWPRTQHLYNGATASIVASATVNQTILTVPNDERWWLEYIRVDRASGDNTALQFRLVFPVGYFTGTAEVPLMDISTAAAAMYWPDLRGEQTVDYLVDIPPTGLLLEPGTVIALAPSGAGVAATIFNYWAIVKRTSIVRAFAP